MVLGVREKFVDEAVPVLLALASQWGLFAFEHDSERIVNALIDSDL
ncbi:MAG: hypothetical protein H0V17_06820 [Deltaproteobacteria bacterium]|nr:hypothetical protein [Deltaproteobacteria bacterium]